MYKSRPFIYDEKENEYIWAKHPMKKFIFLLSITTCMHVVALRAQSVARQRCDAWGKGVNLSNWLEAHWQAGWPTAQGYTKTFLQNIKPSGIRSVRLPIYFEAVVDSFPPYAVDTNHILFDRIDSVIAWTEELDMRLIIDNHHGWPMTDSTWRQHVPRMHSLWGAVSEKYAYLHPERYTFEILNEPSIGFDNDSLTLLYEILLDTIRTHAPGHSVIASPSFASTGFGFADFLPLADTNIIYTVHTYDPYPFTHQGFSWSNPYYAPGTPYPGSGYDFLVDGAWNMTRQWMETYQLPVFLGEFGVGVFADEASRCRWMDTVSRHIHQNNLSWFYWDVQYDFQMFRSGVIDKDSILPCFQQALFLYDDSLAHFSVQEPVAIPGLEVFPNPTHASFTCRVADVGTWPIQVYDLTGRPVFTGQIQQQAQIPTDTWPTGTYIIRVGMRPTPVYKVLIKN